jgi:type II secretory pathway component GspD/PulD (secretin)
MSPTVKQVQSGVMLEVLPTLQAGRDSAVVDVKTRLAEWNDPGHVELSSSMSTTQPGNRAVAGAGSSGIDRLNMVTQDLKTAVRMPLGKPVLVGGLTLDPHPAEPAGQQLYLILRLDATHEFSPFHR